MRHKGQMEIMGLAFIVVIVTLGLLFTLLFFLTKAESNALPQSRQEILAANWINTFLGTTTDCNQQTVRELLIECARSGSSSMFCPDTDACSKVQQVMDDVRQQTLDKWNLQYYLKATGPNDVNTISAGKQCSGKQVLGSQAIPAFGFDLSMDLAICG